MSEKTIDIQKRVYAARAHSFNFDNMVKLCDTQIEHFVSKIKSDNEKPTTILRMPSTPEGTLVSILLPVVPISPNETKLLLEYLHDKYIDGEGGPIVGGDYFCIRKCIFRNNFKLTTHHQHYYDI